MARLTSPAARSGELRYLRRDGNRMVRARRRRRTALRMTVMGLLWALAGFGSIVTLAFAERWATAPGHFPLSRIEVRGNERATEDEVRSLMADWLGKNLFVIPLPDVERKVREHPWIGSPGDGGTVRIQRRVPGTLVVTVGERKPGGLGLVGGVVWLLDEKGMPIDRFGPRYADCDFPIIKGLDSIRKDPKALTSALAAGVAVTRTLAAEQPAFYAQVSEVDVGDPAMIVLRLDGESYDLRISREGYLKNLENYFAVRGQIQDDDAGGIDYVDLRWQDRIAVMPAASTTKPAGDGTGRHAVHEQGGGR